MKLVILSALLIGCVTSASAETKLMGGCELIRMKGSNAYYFSDPECVLGSGTAVSNVRVASRVTPAQPLPVIVDEPQDIVAPRELPTPAILDAVDAGRSEVKEPETSEPETEHPAGDLGSGCSHAGDDHDIAQGSDVGGVDASDPGEGGEQGGSDKPKDDNGHGNHVGGVDPSNPGQSDGKADSDNPKDDNGHGNDIGGVDPSNPGQSDGTGGSDKPKDDNGHGNDVGGVDSSNPGEGSGKGGSDKTGGKANGKA